MKVALVTGAGKGLGKGFVDYLSQNGYVVYAGIHHVEDKIQFKAANIKPLKLDVEDDESIARASQFIEAKEGKLDLLINCAGVNKDTATSNHKDLVTKIRSLDRQSMLKMFNINSLSPLMVTKCLLPLMKGSNCFIINISSDRASFQNAMNDTNANYGYKASKAALNMLNKVLVFDLPRNVSVVAVHPGSVNTNMNPNGSLKPVEAAQKICQIIAKWNPKLNGQFVRNDGSIYPA